MKKFGDVNVKHCGGHVGRLVRSNYTAVLCSHLLCCAEDKELELSTPASQRLKGVSVCSLGRRVVYSHDAIVGPPRAVGRHRSLHTWERRLRGQDATAGVGDSVQWTHDHEA